MYVQTETNNSEHQVQLGEQLVRRAPVYVILQNHILTCTTETGRSQIMGGNLRNIHADT